MSTTVKSSTLRGCEGININVEVNISRGLPSFTIVGLASTTVKESRERVRAAIVNSGFVFPMGRIVINLAPADIRKVGSLVDLPIAVGILIESEQIRAKNIEKYIILGELSLAGELKLVNGVLPAVINGVNNNISSFIIPQDNCKEATLIKEADIYPFNTLKQVCDFLINEDLLPAQNYKFNTCKAKLDLDFSDVFGQEQAKRALEICVAGGHNLILYGPPGCGKTMLAKRIQSILPDLDEKDYIDITKIYSSAGLLNSNNPVITKRPFRAPHHTTTIARLLGGGTDLIPGEVTLAHKGVLFFDELPEFGKEKIDSLREPLENKCINLSRVKGSITYPADYIFLATMNPCPCGKSLNLNGSGGGCTCTDRQKRNYINKISKAILDRIDMFVYVPPIEFKSLKYKRKNISSKEMKATINKVIKVENKRFKNSDIKYNSQMNHGQILKYLYMDDELEDFICEVYSRFNLSTRGIDKILRVSRTIADMDGYENIQKKHVIEALNYRRFIDGEVI